MSTDNPLRAANQAGQSIWLDFINRNLLVSGELQQLIDNDAIAGLTSNPSIFEQAIAGSSDYDDDIRSMVADTPEADSKQLFDQIAIADIQAAADRFRPVYDATNGVDGQVSIEVSPKLARDTDGTIAAARRLHSMADRPNVMIKVPGTAEGVTAFEQLTSEGISVNVTLLFSVKRYREIAMAYIRGLEKLAETDSAAVANVVSVASFFVSRVDSAVDQALEAIGPDAVEALSGKIAIANAQVAYGHFANIFGSAQFKQLESLGARPQRLLWASTGTKNPAFSDVLYVEELIGPDTVNTLPPKTLDAFRDHGVAETRLPGNLAEANAHLEKLATLGISLDTITRDLEDAGIKSFDDAFDRLLASIGEKRTTLGV